MHSIVKELFPNYLDYSRNTKRFINPLITEAFDFPIEVWNQYRDAYYSWCIENNEKDISNFYFSMRNTPNK